MAIVLGGDGVDVALTIGPNIVTDGLVFHIDVASTDSIVTKGGVPLADGVEMDAIYGLIGDGQRVALSGTAGFPYYVAANGGTFYTGTYVEQNVTGILSNPIELGEEYTLEMFVKPKWWYSYGTAWFAIQRTIGLYSPAYVNGLDIVGGAIGATDYPSFAIGNSGGSGTGSDLFWHFAAVFSRITNTVSYYRNGKLLASLPDSLADLSGVRTNTLIRTAGSISYPWDYGDGFVGSMKAYNKTLGAEELFQSYTASRNRYNI